MSVNESTTPTPSPSKRSRTVITAVQKQALIDNLQLEVTERSRKLRAQYALHAQGLRSRLEMRINRIPHSLRSVNIEELIEKYSEQLEPTKRNPLPSSRAPQTQYPKLNSQAPTSSASFASPSRMKGTKRPSSAMTGSDKENQGLDLDLPKKRAKIISAVPGSSNSGARANRAGSRKVNPSQVLSPKSHNSQTIAQSPLRPQMTPGKSYLARPVPISKTAPSTTVNIATPAEKPKPARQRPAAKQAPAAASVRGKRGIATAAPPQPSKQTRNRSQSDLSESSGTSTGTTIVAKKTAPARKGIMGKVAGMATAAGRARAAAAKKETQPAETGKRVLRARK